MRTDFSTDITNIMSELYASPSAKSCDSQVLLQTQMLLHLLTICNKMLV